MPEIGLRQRAHYQMNWLIAPIDCVILRIDA